MNSSCYTVDDRLISLREHFWDEDKKVKPKDGEQLVRRFTQEEVKRLCLT